MARPVPSRAALQYLSACIRPRPRRYCTINYSPHHSAPQISKAQACYSTSRERKYTTNAPGLREEDPGPFRIRKPPRSSDDIMRKREDEVLRKEHTINEDIPARFVQIRDSQTAKLGEPMSLSDALGEIQSETEVLRLLANFEDRPAIVGIEKKSVLLEHRKQKLEQEAENRKEARQTRMKQVELNWAISGHDLDMKLKQLREFVDKGRKVEVLLASKKRQRKATREEAEKLHSKLKATFAEIEGCREIKPMEGEIGKQALITIQKQGK